MPYHIVIKKQEAEVALKLPVVFAEFKRFLVHEVGDDGDHWHFWTDCDWKEAKVRRSLDKVRTGKLKGVSVRKWNDDLTYLCKGTGITEDDKPDVLYNNVLTEEEIEEARFRWWSSRSQVEGEDPDMKPVKILDLLVNACRDEDYVVKDVVDKLVDIVCACKGRKMLGNRSLCQSYVRTALMFTKNGEFYKQQCKDWIKFNLFA